MHDVLVERVLHVGSGVRRSEQALVVRFVLGEEERRSAFAPELPRPERRVLSDDRARRTHAHRPLLLPVPPHVAEPQVGKHVHRRPLRAAVGKGDADRDVLGLVLRVLDVDVEVVVVVEDPGVHELVLELVAAPVVVRGDDVVVGIAAERVAVPVLEIGARRRGVEVEVVLLHVLAVVSLRVGQAEHPLLEDRVDAVPQRDREAEDLGVVAESGDAVLAPLVGARAGLVVGEVLPGVAELAVVLAHGAPLPLADVRTPLLPGRASARRFEPIGFHSMGHRAPLHVPRGAATLGEC